MSKFSEQFLENMVLETIKIIPDANVQTTIIAENLINVKISVQYECDFNVSTKDLIMADIHVKHSVITKAKTLSDYLLKKSMDIDFNVKQLTKPQKPY
jgi:hypothetical protein